MTLQEQQEGALEARIKQLETELATMREEYDFEQMMRQIAARTFRSKHAAIAKAWLDRR
jgi:hypothetical protein